MNENVLPKIRIASPCHADWQTMAGNERVRFCAQCQKSVYNLSAMSAADGARLIRAKEGKLCVRYYARRDGTVLTQDCPVGVAAVRRQFLRIAALFTALLAAIGIGCNREESQPLSGEPTILPEQPSSLLGTPVPPREIMGDVAEPPPPPSTPTIFSCGPTPIMGKVAAPPVKMGEISATE